MEQKENQRRAFSTELLKFIAPVIRLPDDVVTKLMELSQRNLAVGTVLVRSDKDDLSGD